MGRRPQPRPGARRALDVQRPVERGHAVAETAQPAAARGSCATHAVVADLDLEVAASAAMLTVAEPRLPRA